MENKKPRYKSTREAILGDINEYLANNPKITAEAFSWAAFKDSSVVARLQGGGDITTRKLDMVIRYLHVHKKPQTQTEGVSNDQETKSS